MQRTLLLVQRRVRMCARAFVADVDDSIIYLLTLASVSRIDTIIGLFWKFWKRALQRQCSAKETYDFIDPTDRSHPIPDNIGMDVYDWHEFFSTALCIQTCAQSMTFFLCVIDALFRV